MSRDAIQLNCFVMYTVHAFQKKLYVSQCNHSKIVVGDFNVLELNMGCLRHEMANEPVCSQISGPVVSMWALLLAVLSNWLVHTAFSREAA